MNRLSIIALFLALVFLGGQSALAQSGYDLFQKGLVQERAKGDLDEAIRLYKQIVEDFADDRALAAKALVQMGGCYEKLGRTEARKAYERVLHEYPDQHESVSAARVRLTTLAQQEGDQGPIVRQVWAEAADPYFMGAPSPNGKYLSYVDWDTGDLAVHELSSGKNRRLTSKGWSKGRAGHSIFSPDSKYVACRWRSRGGRGLRIIGLDGAERRLIKHPEGITILRPTDWSPDGKHILALGGAMWDDSEGSFRFLKILFVSVEDDDVRVLKTIECLPHRRRSGQFRMSLSPDGRYVAYSFPPADNSGKGDIWVFGTDGGPEIQAVEHPADDFVLGWAPDGKQVVFASDRTGSMGIWAVEVADGKTQGTPQLLKPEIGRFHPLGLTQKGFYYYGVFSGGSNVYTATFDPQEGNVAGKPVVAIKQYEGSNWAPDWSPDGRYLACVSASPGASPVFLIHSVETGEVRKLSPDPKDFNVHSLRWAPDGRSLLGAGKAQDMSWGVLKIDVETGAVTTIVEGPGIFGPNWAADGKTVFYVCNLKTNGRIIRHGLATGEKKELYRASGFISAALALSPDGRQLAFYDIQGGALKVLSATGGEPRELVKVEGEISIAWTPDGSYLVYGLRGLGEGPAQLWRIPAGGGEPQRLNLEMAYLGHLRFHPNGQQITFMGKAEKDKCEVWVMEDFLPQPKPEKPPGIVVRELKIEQGEGGLSLSWDGKKLVYPRRKDGKINLVVRELASGEEKQVTNHETAGARYPVFAPDGKKVAYTLMTDLRDQQLHIVSLETGEDRDLDQYGSAQDWSRDGRFILISPWAEDEAKTLNVLAVDGSSVKKLKVPPRAWSSARFSPDGKYVSYSRQDNIYLYPVDGGEPIQVTDGSARSVQPMWSPDGEMLLFLSPRAFGPEADLCGVSIVDGRATGKIEIIKPDIGENVSLISLSETGRLLFRQSHHEICIYSTALDPQTNQPTGKPVKLAEGQRATWSPDGKRIAYRYGQVLHVMSADGNNDQEIIKVYPFMGPYAWAPDNDHIYMVERVENRAGIYSISISAKERRPVFLDPDIMGHLTCSPDGKRLAFLKLPPSSGKPEIFIVNVDGTNLEQLTSNEDMRVMYPAWSPDGKYIAFNSKRQGEDVRALRVVSVDDRTMREVFRGETPKDQFFWASWSLDGNEIAWTSSGEIRIGQVSDGKYDTFKVDIGASAKSTFHMPRWSADGTKMVFTTYAYVGHLMLMENFLPTFTVSK